MAAKKKPMGSTPFKGATGRKPRGEMGWGKTSGSGKNTVSVRVTPSKTGGKTVSVSQNINNSPAGLEKGIKSATSSRASGVGPKSGQKRVKGGNLSFTPGKAHLSLPFSKKKK